MRRNTRDMNRGIARQVILTGSEMTDIVVTNQTVRVLVVAAPASVQKIQDAAGKVLISDTSAQPLFNYWPGVLMPGGIVIKAGTMGTVWVTYDQV